MRIDSADLRDRIARAFEAARTDCYASLTVLEATEYVRLTWPGRTPSHENMADMGVSPCRVYLSIKHGQYRMVYKTDERFEFLIPAWQPA